jgi:hypothetical protein
MALQAKLALEEAVVLSQDRLVLYEYMKLDEQKKASRPKFISARTSGVLRPTHHRSLKPK